MQNRTKIIIFAICCIVVGISTIAFFVLDNTLKFTGIITEIDYDNNIIYLLNVDTGEHFSVDIANEIIRNYDTGCTLNIFETGRIEIIGNCIIN